MTTTTTLAEQLREETKDEHAALEKAMMPFLKNARDEASYARLLTAMYTYLQPVEEAIFLNLGTAQLPDHEDRRTMTYMAGDLVALLEQPSQLSKAKAFPEISNPAQAFGALYVLEGSTLGGQIVGKILRKNLPEDLHHTRYFDSYGEQTKVMWGAFIKSLNAFGDAHPESLDEVVNTARQTFSFFQGHLEAAK